MLFCFIVKATVHNSHLSLHEAMKKSGQQKRLTEHSKQQHSSHRPLNLLHSLSNLKQHSLMLSHRQHSRTLSHRQHSRWHSR